MSYDHLFKLLVIGDSFVGKTALTTRLTNEAKDFTDRYIETIGIDFKIRTICIDGIRIRLQVWDTAGQAKLNTVTPSYYEHAVGIVLVYNIAEKSSFDNLQGWLQIVSEFASDNVEKVIIGNKADLDDYRQVYHAEGRQLATTYRSLFFEASAKQNYNVMLAFTALARNILSNRNLTPFTLFRQTANQSALALPNALCRAASKRGSSRSGRGNHHHHHHKPSCCYIS